MNPTTEQAQALRELTDVVYAFKIVSNVLNNSSFKPSKFDQVAVTLTTVNEILQELDAQLQAQIAPQTTAASEDVIPSDNTDAPIP